MGWYACNGSIWNDMRNTISLIIPSYNTKEHLINTYKSVRKYYDDVELVIINDGSHDGTSEWIQSLQDDNVIKIDSDVRRGHTYFYDAGMRKASNDIVGILHSDMIIGPNYLENMLKHLKRGKVVCATRIEPPIHPAGLEKIIMDFGMDWNDLKVDEFEEFCLDLQKDKDETTKGIFAPWVLYRDDHFAIGGHDQIFAPYGYEDSDIFNRWILAGYEMIQSRDSLVYHLTCRGHRWNKGVGIENDDYTQTMNAKRREYIRKWGSWIQNDKYQYPIIPPKYNIAFVVRNSVSQILEALEPWCDHIYIDDEMGVQESHYIDKEQGNTAFDLRQRISTIKYQDPYSENDIVIEINARAFDHNDFMYIQQMAEIIEQHDDTGVFELGSMQITINALNDYSKDLIFIEK